MHLLNEKIYTAHGPAGVVVFDLNTRQIEKVIKTNFSRGHNDAVSITETLRETFCCGFRFSERL